MCLDINGILCSIIPNSGKDIDDKSVRKCNSNNIKFIRPEIDYFIGTIASQFDIIFYTFWNNTYSRKLLILRLSFKSGSYSRATFIGAGTVYDSWMTSEIHGPGD